MIVTFSFYFVVSFSCDLSFWVYLDITMTFYYVLSLFVLYYFSYTDAAFYVSSVIGNLSASE